MPPNQKAKNTVTGQQELAKVLVQTREGAGLTQKELASRMRTSQSAIARIESGRGVPSISTLRKLAKATGHELVITFLPERGAAHR